MTEKEMLQRLMRFFHYEEAYNGLVWSYVEDVTVDSLDEELGRELFQFIIKNVR